MILEKAFRWENIKNNQKEARTEIKVDLHNKFEWLKPLKQIWTPFLNLNAFNYIKKMKIYYYR